MAENVTQSELDKLNSTAKTAAASSDETKTYEGKFIGTLIGNATTAKELEAPYNFTLSGDVTGSASVNAGDLIMPVTVNHSAHADTSDFAGKTQLANRSNVADMANTAEFAYRAGKIAKIIINLTGVVTGKGESTNSESVDIEVTDFDASKQFVVGALATEPDTSKVYIDVAGKHLWIYDNTGAVWVDCFKQLADELDSHNLRIEALEALNAGDRLTALEGRADALEKTKTNHEQRITTNEETLVQHGTRITTNTDNITALTTRIESIEEVNTTQTANIADHEKRINNMETSSDVGQFATRIQAVEDKNIEQDKSIKANTDSIAVNTKAIADETKARQEADNTLSQSVQNEIQPKIDTLTAGLAKEIEDRKSADTTLSTSVTETIQPKIDDVSSKLTQEIEDRTTAVSDLTSTVTNNKTATDESISNLSTQLDNNIKTLTTNLSSTNSEINKLANKVVTIDGAQTITGAKTFSAQISAASFLASSDKKLKDNILPSEYTVSNIKAYTYYFKKDTKKIRHVGLLAQEVQKSIPYAVQKTANYLAVDYNAIVAVLVDEINQLKNRIAKLEKNI